jgi:hypothetical protein
MDYKYNGMYCKTIQQAERDTPPLCFCGKKKRGKMRKNKSSRVEARAKYVGMKE